MKTRFISMWMCILLVVSLFPTAAYASNEQIANLVLKVDSKRLSGQTRIQTAISICREGWPSSAGTVILTRDDNYPDALSGTPLSKKLDAPILFTNSLTLTPETEAEIARLKPSKVVILGGSGAVSQGIEIKLSKNYAVQRIGGADRYETASKIAKELGYKGKAVITTGEDFHSALVVSSLAAYKGVPILLTLPYALPSFTKEALQFVAPSETIVVGDVDEVYETVFNELTSASRITGSDIFQTAVTVARNFGADPNVIFFATGKDFPDALAGSALAAKNNSPILFVNEPISSYVRQYLTENKDRTAGIRLLGGEGVISEAIKTGLIGVIEGNETTTPPSSTVKSPIGSWMYSAASGSVGFTVMIELKEDGTFIKALGSVAGYSYFATAFEGKYRISGDKLVFYNQLKSTAYASSSDELWKMAMSKVKDIPVEDSESQFSMTDDNTLLLNGSKYKRY